MVLGLITSFLFTSLYYILFTYEAQTCLPKQELSGRPDIVLLGELGAKQTVNNTLQPAGPGLKASLLLQRVLEALLKAGDGGGVAATDPACLLLKKTMDIISMEWGRQNKWI